MLNITKQNITTYFTEFGDCMHQRFRDETVPNNYIFITLVNRLDYTVYDQNIKNSSPTITFIIIDEYGTIVNNIDLNCEVQIYFPLIDNLKLNSSSLLSTFNSLYINGINIFNQKDSFFVNFCYIYFFQNFQNCIKGVLL